MNSINANDRIQYFVILGIFATLVGVGVALGTWPSEELIAGDCRLSPGGYGAECDDDTTSSTGSQPWAIAGIGLAFVGNLMLLVGLIGHAVKLGITAATSED